MVSIHNKTQDDTTRQRNISAVCIDNQGYKEKTKELLHFRHACTREHPLPSVTSQLPSFYYNSRLQTRLAGAGVCETTTVQRSSVWPRALRPACSA